MHSHDRTLLASLGFNDPDKKLREHDLACEYLMTEECGVRLVDMFLLDGFEFVTDYCERESEITKGEGKYKTTIGFIDLIIGADRDNGNPDETKNIDFARICVEVKITKVGSGDILRQIALYHRHLLESADKYTPEHIWVVAIAFPMSEIEIQSIERQGIGVIQLSDGFRSWLKTVS